MKNYDVILIGAGAAGLNLMSFLHKAGIKTLLVTKKADHIGGDCLNWGCVPSKALLHVAKTIESARSASRYTASDLEITVDPDKVFSHVKQSVETIKAHENLEYFREERGWTIVVGAASFVGKNKITVDKETFVSKKIIIATGSKPRSLDVPGKEMVDLHTNETIFSLNRIPKKLLVVGGGPIGLELGQAFALLGSKVTIIDRGDTFMSYEHPKVSSILKRKLDDLGINFIFNATLKKFTNTTTAELEVDSKIITETFESVLAAVGREVRYDDLNLTQAAVTLSDRGLIKINDYLQTTNPNIFVSGDAAGPPFFTHATELHASVILNNFFKPKLFWKKLSYDTFSWVTYTSPQLGTFGQSEKQLQDHGINFKVIEKPFAENDRMIVDNTTDGLLRLYIDKKQRLLGGTMVGTNAGELIQELILLMTLGKPLSTLLQKIYAYPIQTRINKEATFIANADRLTGRTKWLLQKLFNLFS